MKCILPAKYTTVRPQKKPVLSPTETISEILTPPPSPPPLSPPPPTSGPPPPPPPGPPPLTGIISEILRPPPQLISGILTVNYLNNIQKCGQMIPTHWNYKKID